MDCRGYLCRPMIISYQWLLEYLPRPIPVEELSRILTSIGLEVEAVEKAESIKGGLEGLLIGEVLSCAPHPNADKLRVTTVTTGGADALQIVCGASNVAAGQRVVVAPVGATPKALIAITFLVLGLYINVWVSPPQLRTSNIVQVAANMAQDASMALPPLLKIIAPAVAASGLPVIAIQCLPCKGGF